MENTNEGGIGEYISYFNVGQLKCEDCVYDSNCEEKFKRCVANAVSPSGVVHMKWCEKDYVDEMKSRILEVLELVNAK